MQIPSGLNPLNELAQLKALLAENTQALRAMTVRNAFPPLPQRPSQQLVEPPGPDYAEEDLIGGEMRLVNTNIVATPKAADCRGYPWVSIAVQTMVNVSTPIAYSCYVLVRGSQGRGTSNGVRIGAPVLLYGGNTRVVLHLPESKWMPYVYLEAHAPNGNASWPIRLRAWALKRRAG